MSHPCQVKRMSYPEWHEYADRMVARGAKQKWCRICERWKFKRDRCLDFREGVCPHLLGEDRS